MTIGANIVSRFLGGIRSIGREFWYFLTSFVFVRNFAAMIGMLVLLFFVGTWFAKCYTHHGESLQVENLVGMKVPEAIKVAEDRGLEIVVNDSVFIVGKEPHTVLSQHPEALSRVKEGRTIYLSATKYNPDMVTLPDLAGSDGYDQYTRKLKILGIKYSIRERVFNIKYAPNTVMHFYHGDKKIEYNDLRKGIKVPMGSELGFVVTERSSGRVPLPDMVCKDFSTAEFLVTTSKLSIGNIVEDATVTNRSSAYVYKQKPDFRQGATIRLGRQVDLYLTQRKPSGCQ